MSAARPDWGEGSRFFLPNEDAAVTRAAVALFRNRFRRPVFVGGSGMLLLETAGELAALETATFVDVAAFQLAYFQTLLGAIRSAETPTALTHWFARAVYPRLRDHYRARGRDFALEQVMSALAELFGIRFFFDQAVLDRVRARIDRIVAVRADIGGHLAAHPGGHDLIVLGNVPDYLDLSGLETLFSACRRHQAPVLLLLTSACPDPDLARRAWEAAGYQPHPHSPRLDAANRGLGSPRLARSWNRPGTIHLLVDVDQRSPHG